MSGPKLSEAELARIREMEEERRRLCQDVAREIEKFKRHLSDLNMLIHKAVLVNDEDAVSDVVATLNAYQKKVKKCMEKLEKTAGVSNNETIREALQEAYFDHDAFEILMSESDQTVTDCRKKITKEFLKKMAAARKSANQKSVGRNSKTEAEREIISKEFLNSEKERIDLLLDQLEKRAESVFLSKEAVGKLRRRISEITNDTGRDNYSMYEELNRIEITMIEPFERKVKRLEKEADELDIKLSAELATYHRICREVGVEPKKFRFSKESIEEIRYACAELLDQCDLGADISALMKGIKESLTALGYNYIGEKEENRDLYRQIYGIHDNIILHVIYDSTGRVTMEVAIRDTVSRSPQPREKEGIVKEQKKFCGDYEKIFNVINQRGIALRKKAEMPCDPAFARVIDSTEFTCAEKAEEDYYTFYADRTAKYLRSN